ncbi:o-succinylbenzoate synthase [Adhaeribacter aquaticus]|uniref:o-succinylbenzoate synthase n=1 Tax=Adhaeribacter aquaticus TaxID=299567 RepID=UPI0004111617|nr:o-succinylbenzoate synthase [Adhaeribacter aquaticus]
MALQIEIIPHTLQFKFSARTSRGAMQQHQVFFLKLADSEMPHIFGIGECAPLPGLSLEHHAGFNHTLSLLVADLNKELTISGLVALKSILNSGKYNKYPSLIFALETAIMDYEAGGNRMLYQNSFSKGEAGIPINGLIWMGDEKFMKEQISKKLNEGYSCLKLKIGSLDFDTELAILKSIRAVASAAELIIRVDANGAFNPQDALPKLEQLAAFHIHSIEQPIKQGQAELMKSLCQESPVAIALDEELICISEKSCKVELLNFIQPQYIILKPTLIGGLQASAEWISLAEERRIGWWVTSALESNIGLNAISQFTAQYPIKLQQGLGTGQLYYNNITSPLFIYQGELYYQSMAKWSLEF